MMPSDGQRRRNARRQQINDELSVLPKFTPLTPYRICHINRSTSPRLLHELVRLAKATYRYTIDTEKDSYTHVPALVQIEFIGNESTIVLIETCYLPKKSTVLFWLIKSLLNIIFKSRNLLFSWGDLFEELVEFFPTDLFTLQMLTHANYIDVQYRFKVWCQRTFKDEDLNICVSSNLIRSYASMINDDEGHKWSLQMAVAFAFDEFLDKSLTVGRWSRPLDIMLIHGYLARKGFEERTVPLIEYAARDVLAVTKLVRTFGFNACKEQELRNLFL